MSSKTTESNVGKEDSKSVPLRRSLRLSSCSPTPTKVLSNSATSKGSPHPSKLGLRRRLSGELSVKSENIPTTRRSTRSISSIPEEDLPKPEKKSPKKVVSPQKDNSNENIEKDNIQKNVKTQSLEAITEVDEETKVTKPSRNLMTEDATIEKEAGKQLVVLLEHIEVSGDGVTTLTEVSQDKKDSDMDTIQSEPCLQESLGINKENLCPEKKDSGDKSNFVADGLPYSQSEPESNASLTLVPVTASPDTVNQSLKNSQSEDKSVTNTDKSEELENSQTTETHNVIDKEESTERLQEGKADEEEPLQDNEENSSLSNKSDIDSKIDDLLKKHDFSNSEDEDDEEEQNSFIDGMAEEGEEDTPSEGSNDIVEVGEEINTTESELSSDGSYDKDSFIDDDDEHPQLLSGEEYDLSINSPGKKSRIICLSSGSDDEIVTINRVKKEKPKKKRKSRILKFSDSSEEEAHDDNVKEKVTELQENESEPAKLNDIENRSEEKTVAESEEHIRENEHSFQEQGLINKENDKNIDNMEVASGENLKVEERDLTTNKDNSSVEVFLESFKDEIQSEIERFKESTIQKVSKTDIFTLHEQEEEHETFGNVETAVEIDTEVNREKKEYTSSTPNKTHVDIFDEDKEEENKLEIEETKDNISFNASISYINEESQDNQNLKTKIVVIENIRVQDIKDKSLSDQINELIDSWSSGINSATDVTINLSLNYVNKSEESAENQEERVGIKKTLRKTISLPGDNEAVFNEKSQEIILKKRKKKRSRKRKASVNVSSEETVEANENLHEGTLVKKKIKRKKHVENDVDQKKSVDLHIERMTNDAIETEEMKSSNSNKKRKRKHPKNEISLIIEENIEDEPGPVKKKKRKTLKNSEFREEIRTINIIDEAVQINKRNKLILLTPDISESKDWDAKKHVVKPSLRPTQKVVDKIEYKTIKCSTSENVQKFHVKDFKNAMLFDPARVRRADTKQIIKRKMY